MDPRHRLCELCDGGTDPPPMGPCPSCQGTGVKIDRRTGRPRIFEPEESPDA